MSYRRGWAPTAAVLVVVAGLGIAAVAGAFTPLPQRPAEPASRSDPEPITANVPTRISAASLEPEPRPSNRRPDVRTATRPLVEDIAARVEAFESLQGRLVEQQYSVLLAEHEVNSALTALQIAELALRDFREALYPQLLGQAQAQHRKALELLRYLRFQDSWSGVLKKNHQRSKESTKEIQDRIVKAEEAVAQAKAGVEELAEKVYVRQVKELQDRIDEATKGVQLRRDDLGQKRRKADELAALIDRESLSPAERRAVVLLDETLSLAEEGNLEEARSRLDEARGYWLAEQERRAVELHDRQRRTIQQAAERFRDSTAPPDPRPTPDPRPQIRRTGHPSLGMSTGRPSDRSVALVRSGMPR